VGIAGDHRSLNNNNLILRAFERRQDLAFVQIGYLGAASMSLEERLRLAGPVDAWVVIEPPKGVDTGLWTTSFAVPVEERLASDVRYRRLPWRGELSDGSQVSVYASSSR
jgi:hypothetical protein